MRLSTAATIPAERTVRNKARLESCFKPRGGILTWGAEHDRNRIEKSLETLVGIRNTVKEMLEQARLQ